MFFNFNFVVLSNFQIHFYAIVIQDIPSLVLFQDKMWIYKGSKDCCNGVRNFNWVLVPPIAFSLTVPYFIFSWYESNNLFFINKQFLHYISYIQGALNSHYNGLFPLVSDTGNYIPEAANFSVIITGIGLFCKLFYRKLHRLTINNLFQFFCRQSQDSFNIVHYFVHVSVSYKWLKKLELGKS